MSNPAGLEVPLPINKLDLNLILNMPAGPEMDALVAREVMGYSVDFEEQPLANGDARRIWFIISGDGQLNRSKVPGFSTDIEAAWKVQRKMRSHGDALSLQHRNMVDNAPGSAIWTAWFGKPSDLAWATTPPLAICRAALLAVRGARTPAPAGKPVPANFFSIIEHELARIMGPIAGIMVDDKIAEFGESRDNFPDQRIDPFIKAISEEIADSSERAAFDAAMAEFSLPKRRGTQEPAGKPVPANFFSIIEHELARIMGPIAGIMVDDKIAEFGESRDNFPDQRIDPFIKAISEEIADSSERAAFDAAMAECSLPKRRKF